MMEKEVVTNVTCDIRPRAMTLECAVKVPSPWLLFVSATM